MDAYYHAAPVVQPAYAWEAKAPYQPKADPRAFAFLQQTQLRSAEVRSPFDEKDTGSVFPSNLKPASSEVLATHFVSESSRPKSVQAAWDQPSEVDAIAKQRVKLLAMKYAGGSDVQEVIARLEILNQRLINRAPRVTQGQVDALEKTGEMIARMREGRERRARLLGLLGEL